jgi:hypothetical protein
MYREITPSNETAMSILDYLDMMSPLIDNIMVDYWSDIYKDE